MAPARRLSLLVVFCNLTFMMLLQSWKLVDFVQVMIGKAYSLMVETERVNQSESGGFNASGMSGEPYLTKVKKKNVYLQILSFLARYIRHHR